MSDTIPAPEPGYLTQLRELLSACFNEGELRTLCFDLGIDYDDLPGQGKANKARELAAYFARRGHIPELVEKASKYRPDQFASYQLQHQKHLSTQQIPFINRKDEISLIVSSYAQAYTLIDAPAGYGKTELLKELERRFKELEWACAYVSIGEKGTLPKVAAALAQQLGLDANEVLRGEGPANLAGNLAAEILGKDIAKNKNGLVLLVDFEGKPRLAILPDLLKTFVPAIQQALYNLNVDFMVQHNWFRVIIAGRYLANRPEVSQLSLPLEIRRLTPFSYEIVRDTVRAYLRGPVDNVIVQIAAHLMHLTGGHPGCVAKTLEIFNQRRLLPDMFLEQCGDRIRAIVHQVVEDIRYDIQPAALRNKLDSLSVLRYVDYEALGQLLMEEDKYHLADELTSTYLLDWVGHLLRDDITRRLLAIRLRWDLGDEGFARRCQDAQRICINRLKDPYVQGPEMWAIEYLFQSLQQLTTSIHNPQARQNATRVFREEIPKTLHMLVTPPRNKRSHYQPLKQALDKDWEFRFTVNYYLRQDGYTNKPYEDLLRQVDSFFV